MNVALYARYSSDNQDGVLSIGGQLRALKEYAQRHEYRVFPQHIYIDEAKSATTDRRPAFRQMMADAEAKQFSLVLVYKFSRFARSRLDSILNKRILAKNGIKVVSICERVDETPNGHLMSAMIEAFDEFYSLNLAHDVKRGLLENARRGFFNGGFTPYGYKCEKVQDGNTTRSTLEIDEDTSPIVNRMFLMAYKGDGLKKIASTLNRESIQSPTGMKWGISVVRKILSREVYTGTYVWNKESGGLINQFTDEVRTEDAHTPIVSKEIFETVQENLAKRAANLRFPKYLNSPYLLSEFLYCGVCSHSINGTSGYGKLKKKYLYYGCTRRIKQSRDACSLKNIPKDELEDLILNHLASGIVDQTTFERMIYQINQEFEERQRESASLLSTLDSQLSSINHKLNKIYEAIETGKVELDDLSPRIKTLREKILEVEAKMALEETNLKKSMKRLDLDAALKAWEQMPILIKATSVARKKEILAKVIKRADVFPDRIELETNLPLMFLNSEENGGFDLSVQWLGEEDSNPH